MDGVGVGDVVEGRDLGGVSGGWEMGETDSEAEMGAEAGAEVEKEVVVSVMGAVQGGEQEHWAPGRRTPHLQWGTCRKSQ